MQSGLWLQAQADLVPEPAAQDSTPPALSLDTLQARRVLMDALQRPLLWGAGSGSTKEALRRLLEQLDQPYDSAMGILTGQDFGEILLEEGPPVVSDTIPVRWLNDSTFVADPQGWSPKLYLKKEMTLKYKRDLSTLSLSDSTLLDENGMLDSTLFIPDTIWHELIDTAALQALEIKLHSYINGKISPPLSDPAGKHRVRISRDLQAVEYFTPSSIWIAEENSLFRLVENEFFLDSLQAAVNSLLDFTRQRDSTLLLISDLYGREKPLWMGSGKEDKYRYWVKNFNDDSITLWIGNPGYKKLSLLLEDEVNLTRMTKEEISHLPLFIEPPRLQLYEMKMLEPIPIYWDYELQTALSLSQTYLANWTKGGESTFSTMMDITGKATYNNKEAKTQWINIARLKFGTLMTEEKGFRKNHDQLELDSKYNRNAWSKFGLSASLYMKHQIAKGYKYFGNDSSVVVSRFLNPGTMTIGLGAEWKHIEKTTINKGPVSYKTTFVFDTAHIDQTAHGIEADKWAKRELGLQVVVDNQWKPTKGMEITNRVRLFSNYLNKPQNVDVDWEIILEQKINWFFTVRLNLHMIYDDDVRFTLYDDDETPVLLPDGSERKVAKMQFKEFVGLSLNFKF